MRIARGPAVPLAKGTLCRFSGILTAAAILAAGALAPVPAESRENVDKVPADPNQPMTIVVSLSGQKANVYRGTSLITSTRVSTGKRGYATKAGVYSILEKRRRHFSNLYAGAPMPWMQRLTWTGTALHAGVVPGYPASHGCIRLPYSFAPKLFAMTKVGAQVVIARSMVSPKTISHPALFQPLPPPMPPMSLMDNVEEPDDQPVRRSSSEPRFPIGTGLPVVLTKGEAVAPTVVNSPEVKITGDLQGAVARKRADSDAAQLAELKDTRTHAIDPTAAPFLGSASHGVALKSDGANRHATAGTSDDFLKHQDRLDSKHPDRLGSSAGVSTAAAQSGSDSPKDSAPEARLAMKIDAPNLDGMPTPVLTVSASPLAQPVREPVSGFIRMLTADDHPPLPPVKPSVMAARLNGGASAAAVEAAEPRSSAPLRVLVTRSTKRDRLIDMQHVLSAMGHLAPQNFDGTVGSATIRAIKSFQKANDLPQTGTTSDDVIKKIYDIAGKSEPPTGRLFIRQEFASVLSVPVHLRNSDKPLGTHLFTVLHFEPGATEAKWSAISLNDKEDASTVLDRIEIPDDIRQNISERLTPGSSLIVADTAINSAALPKGADFLVWDTSQSAKVQRASVSPRPRKKKRVTSTRRRKPVYTRSYRKPRRVQQSRGFGRGWPF